MPSEARQLDDADLIRRWASDPELFVREGLRVKRISKQQLEGLRELKKLVVARLKLADGAKLTSEELGYAKKYGMSIMSGHGTGKDAFLAWAILWFLFCFPNPKIPCTAPTQHQLRDVLWGEVHKWMRHSALEHSRAETGFDITEWITWGADRIFYTEAKGREWFAVARTCNTRASAEEQAGTLQGFHEDFLMICIDEASEVPDPVIRPLEATMTGKCNFVIYVFNPTKSTGFAIDSQTASRGRFIALRWNAEDSENVSPESCERIAEKYGRDSNAYRIRVLGLPPKADPDTLIPWDWVMSCVEQDLEPLPEDPLIMAIDVGRFGEDKSIIMTARGPVVEDIVEFQGIDTEQLANWAMGMIHEFEPIAVMVDVVGIGAGVADKLRHRVGGCSIFDVNTSEVPAEQPDRFFKLRDELWWKVRTRFEKRDISIPKDDELMGELTVVKYEPDDRRIKVESKKQMRSRGLASPNKADALCMLQYFQGHFLRRMNQGPRFGTRRRRPGESWKTS